MNFLLKLGTILRQNSISVKMLLHFTLKFRHFTKCNFASICSIYVLIFWHVISNLIYPYTLTAQHNTYITAHCGLFFCFTSSRLECMHTATLKTLIKEYLIYRFSGAVYNMNMTYDYHAALICRIVYVERVGIEIIFKRQRNCQNELAGFLLYRRIT